MTVVYIALIIGGIYLAVKYGMGDMIDAAITPSGSSPPLPANILAIVDSTAAGYGVNQLIAEWQAWTESRGNATAVSPAGAVGIMQLMPATAAQYGLTTSEQLTDPEANIDAGIHYLSDLLDQFGDDYSLALAAYNAGPGNVKKYNGIPPFTETQAYVSGILLKAGYQTA